MLGADRKRRRQILFIAEAPSDGRTGSGIGNPHHPEQASEPPDVPQVPPGRQKPGGAEEVKSDPLPSDCHVCVTSGTRSRFWGTDFIPSLTGRPTTPWRKRLRNEQAASMNP